MFPTHLFLWHKRLALGLFLSVQNNLEPLGNQKANKDVLEVKLCLLNIGSQGKPPFSIYKKSKVEFNDDMKWFTLTGSLHVFISK